MVIFPPRISTFFLGGGLIKLFIRNFAMGPFYKNSPEGRWEVGHEQWSFVLEREKTLQRYLLVEGRLHSD